MTKVNRGKQFEKIVRTAFQKIPDVSVDRLHDQTTGYLGSSNICDFIVYKKPYEYYIECKSVHGASLPFSNITDTQWQGMLEKSQIKGVFAGVICWWIDKDVTRFMPIQVLDYLREEGYKSIRFDAFPFRLDLFPIIEITGKKKRVFFDYDMKQFFEEMEENKYGKV